MIKDYIEKRENNQLTTQIMKSQLKPQPESLTTAPDNRIRFGDQVMIKCEGTYNKPSLTIAKANRQDCYISTAVSYSTEPSIPATGIPHPIISDKTALILQSVDGTLLGNTIKFGQPFAISTFDNSVFFLFFSKSKCSQI
jgi:hypothetical protein